MSIKEKLKESVKFLLLVGSSLYGFLSAYTTIWLKLGMPGMAWGLVVCILSAILSCFGTITWIIRG